MSCTVSTMIAEDLARKTFNDDLMISFKIADEISRNFSALYCHDKSTWYNSEPMASVYLISGWFSLLSRQSKHGCNSQEYHSSHVPQQQLGKPSEKFKPICDDNCALEQKYLYRYGYVINYMPIFLDFCVGNHYVKSKGQTVP